MRARMICNDAPVWLRTNSEAKQGRQIVWTIIGAVWGQHQPITARSGERVLLSFHNMSVMGPPMHLHGHVFQVVVLNGRRVAGALRDTVHVQPISMVDVALDAGEAAHWLLRCPHTPHLATGMMTEFAVTASVLSVRGARTRPDTDPVPCCPAPCCCEGRSHGAPCSKKTEGMR